MSQRVEGLVKQIATLKPSERELLLEKVAELNFKRGLKEISEKYRNRLADQQKLNQKADEILAELELIRDEISMNEYRTF